LPNKSVGPDFGLAAPLTHCANPKRLTINIRAFGDGCMPLHLTIHHDGWKGDNPKGYATSHMHGTMEGYADTNVSLIDLKPELKPPVLLQDPFHDVIQYLYASNAEVEPLYALNKEGAFQQHPLDPRGKMFMLQAVARGSQMLLNLWYTAYIQSHRE
jgi:hypothetical protein